MKLLPEHAYLEAVADVVAHSRGGITWDAAMNMPVPALYEAQKRLWKRWEKMAF